jgi:hypothetical protein
LPRLFRKRVPKWQQLRRTLRPHDQEVLSGTDDSVRRGGAADSVREFVAHYHSERNHQGIGNRLVLPGPDLTERDGVIRCRSRLGGMLNYYDRVA